MMLTLITRLIAHLSAAMARLDQRLFDLQSRRRVDRMFQQRGWEIAPANDNSPVRKGD